MSKTLVAKKAKREIIVCSDLENSEFHQSFGKLALSEEESNYIFEELGDDFTLDVVEDY